MFLFDDGSIYRVSITKKRLENDLTICYDSGVWVGDNSNISIRTGKDVFKAYIDENGFLCLVKGDQDPVLFYRVVDLAQEVN